MTSAEFRENLLVAFDTLRTHKVRSLLTVVGIVIGVTSVISVAAIIEGLNNYIQAQVASFGSRTFFITRFPPGTGPGRMPAEIRKRKYFEYTDADFLREACPNIGNITTFGTRAFFFGPGNQNEIRYGNEKVERVFIRGVEPEYAVALPIFSIANGRFISRYDVDHTRPVVVIGNAIANALFPNVDPLEKTVRLNGKLYEVIGVMEPYPGMFGGPGVDDFALIPLTNFKKNYPEAKELMLAFSVPEGMAAETGKDQVTDALRRLRKVPHWAPNDFEVMSPDFFAQLWNQLTGAMFLLTGIISSIGLLVGGIGVMNIMLISVTERTSEIGVRKAIGARKSDIRVQFLLEAVVVTLAGGIIGILIGGMIATGIRLLMPSIPATVSLLWVCLGVAMSVSVGIFFGYYPATRAANLDPIVCLRYE
jgi:ABC-type antimicrobial peptide transport system permease subunit